MQFDWDADKAASNLKKHGVSFDEASEAFDDEFCFDIYDDAHSDFDEDHFLILGLTKNGVLIVAYTVREAETYRIISARKAARHEEDVYWNERAKHKY